MKEAHNDPQPRQNGQFTSDSSLRYKNYYSLPKEECAGQNIGLSIYALAC